MRPEDKWLVAEGKLAVAVVAKADADHVDPCSHDGLPRPELRPGRACRKGVGRNESPSATVCHVDHGVCRRARSVTKPDW